VVLMCSYALVCAADARLVGRLDYQLVGSVTTQVRAATHLISVAMRERWILECALRVQNCAYGRGARTGR
jgi:hypothetical protein